MSEAWNPDQYLRFRAEREQPFRDLLALVRKKPAMRVCDLGCGTGALTAELHRELGARETVGVDLSPAMLAKAPRAEGLRFVEADIERFEDGKFDLVFSNAALHWVPDHGSLLERLTGMLAPGGQLAFQVPSQDAHPSHETAFEIAAEHRFKRHFSGQVRRAKVAEPSQYASWLYHFGHREQHVRLQIYLHLLPAREDVVEWVKGALLTPYQEQLPPPVWEEFLARYREVLLPRLADEKPFPYPYSRILAWGTL
ncbi:MAG: methyltransferase domain-containing protein [Myxococcales bacterium]